MGITVRFMPKREQLDKMSKLYPDFKMAYVEAIQILFQLSGDLEKALEQHYSRHKFSRARYLVMMVLFHADSNRMCPFEIAQNLNVTRGNMTGLIDALLRDGMVKKIQDKEDRRMVWIELTAKGEAFLKKIFPDNFKRISKFMSNISREEIDSFLKVARKLHSSLTAFTDEEISEP